MRVLIARFYPGYNCVLSDRTGPSLNVKLLFILVLLVLA